MRWGLKALGDDGMGCPRLVCTAGRAGSCAAGEPAYFFFRHRSTCSLASFFPAATEALAPFFLLPRRPRAPTHGRVDKLPMDAPDHSLVDPNDVPTAFQKHFAKQQRGAEAAAQQGGTADREEL